MLTRRTLLGATVAAATLASPRRASASARPLVVSVLTCRRPRGVSYLAGTLAAVDADLSCERLLVCDGEAIADPADWEVIALPPRPRAAVGIRPDNKVPGWAAIRAALARGADLLFLEDDVRPLQRGAFASMARHEIASGASFASFFSRGRRVGLHAAADFQLSQAVKLPYRSLEVLARAEETDPLQWLAITGVDLAMSAFGRIAGWNFEQTANLVEHIGLWSAANPT